jgi:hypothetical protein
VAPSLAEMARKCAGWSADHLEALTFADPAMPLGLGARAMDNWRPLVAIADRLGGGWAHAGREVALVIASQGDSNALSELLMLDIEAIFAPRTEPRLPTSIICRELANLEGRPWSKYASNEAITPPQVAKLLAGIGIEPKCFRFGDKTLRGYQRGQFGRDLGTLGRATTQQAPTTAETSPSPGAAPQQPIADLTAVEPAESRDCCVVAALERGAV